MFAITTLLFSLKEQNAFYFMSVYRKQHLHKNISIYGLNTNIVFFVTLILINKFECVSEGA